MKKLRVVSAMLTLALLLAALTGCGKCKHEWEEANCKAPKTCKLCGQTEGEKTEDHQWEEATTDTPKTCTVCYATEGDKIDVDSRFTTAACKDVFGNWVAEYVVNGEKMGIPGMQIPMRKTMRFSNDGEVTVEIALTDAGAFEGDLAEYLSDMVYQQYAADGMSKEQADLIYQDKYGKSVLVFFTDRAKQIIAHIPDTEEMVYYVEEGRLYTGMDWGDTMTSGTIEVADGQMQLEDSELGQVLNFRKTAK